MKKKNWKTGLSWALCVFMLLTCFFPVSATALEGAGANPQEKQQSEGQAAGGSQDEQKTSFGDSKQQDAKKDEAAGAKTQQQKKGLSNNTETRAALSSIIAKDKDGNELCYTTLYDSKDRIVDTNDPKKKQDTYYKQKSQGGQGGTIDPGAGLRVYFRMAEIVEHDGVKGVQENTTYYMELPSALIPMEKDKKGNKLVDPDEPVTFFKNGDIECIGGIYSCEDDNNWYELQMQFENVEDQLEISGGFQYGVTASKDLKPGESCTLDFMPGGALHFTVTPEKEESAASSESLNLSASDHKDSKDKIDWTLTLTDKDLKLDPKRIKVKFDKGSAILADKDSNDAEDVIKMSSVKITYKNGTTETLKQQRMNSNGFSYYREKDSYDPTITYDKEKKRGIICTAYVDESDYKNEGTVVERSGRCSLVETLYIDMCGLESNGSRAGNNSGSSDPAALDAGIEKYEFTFTSQIYDNYNLAGKGYTAQAIMTGVEENSDVLTSAYAGIGKSFGMPQGGYLNDSTQYSSNQYEGMPKYIQTNFNASNKEYYGNYYWMEFTPQHRYHPGGNSYQYMNDTNANYYTNNYSFFERGGSLTGRYGTFQEFNIGNGGSDTQWNFYGPRSYSEIQAGITSSLGGIFDQSDLAMQYQMKQVFGSMDRNKSLLLYRSSEKVNGRYVYIVIDPDTRETARKNYSSNGWGQLVEMKNASSSYGTESAKPAKWKVHVFNAPGQDVGLRFKQSHGSLITEDKNTGGSTTDSMVSSNTVYGTAPSWGQAAVSYSGYGFARKAASVMTGRWVDDNTIFWEFTCNTENWNNRSDWRFSDFYVKVPRGQTLLIGESNFSSDPHRSIDGQSILSNGFFYKTSSGVWSQCGGSKTSYNLLTNATIKDNSPGTTMSADSGETIYFIGSGSAPTSSVSSSTYGSFPQYDGKHIKIGFFTRVDNGSVGTASSCQAELVAATGDMTEWGSSGSTQYPFKVKATGTIPWMPVSKGLSDTKLETEDDSDVSNIQDTWKLSASSYGTNQGNTSSDLIDSTSTGFYSGSWAVHDDMTKSSATDRDNNTITVNPADHTKLKSMKITAAGPGGQPSFDVKAGDLKKAEEAVDHQTTLTSGKVTLTLTYAGNMKDGFDLQMDGLKDAANVNITYNTSFDQKEFCEAAEEAGNQKDTVYQVNMTNGASSGSWDGGPQPLQSQTVKRNIVASLAMNKAVITAPKKDEKHGGYEAGYRLDTQVGYTATKYVLIEDFLKGYNDSGSKSGKAAAYTEKDKEALQTLDKAVDLKDMKITVSGPGISGLGSDKTQEIYSGGVRDGQWSGRAENGWVVDFIYKPVETFTAHPGSLYKVKVSRADGSKVPADTKISITYNLELDMDRNSAFRDSQWYHGGNLTISNGGEAVIPYKSGTPVAKSKKKAKTAAGSEEDPILKVDCGAGVKAEFLADELVRKIRTSSEAAGSKTSWMIYNWTGTTGKDDVTAALKDAGAYDIGEFTYKDPETGNTIKLSEMTDADQKSKLLGQLTYALQKHTKFENIKVYYAETKLTDSRQLTEKDLLCESKISFKGTDQEQTERNTVRDHAGKEHTVTITTRTPQKNSSAVGFDIVVDNLERDRYLAATYDTETDWEAFFKEIHEQYPNCTIQTIMKNKVENSNGAEKEESGNHIEILEEGLQKSLESQTPSAGRSSWKLKVNTGFSKNKKITLTDNVSIAADDARVKKAAEAALQIDQDSIVVKQGKKVIYKNRKLQADGWTEDNLIIKADVLELNVTIQNTDTNKVLAAGQDYIVEYATVLDQDAYIANGGKTGDSAKLQNSAVMDRGGSQFQASAESSFEPEIPVDAEKKYKGNGSGGEDTSTTLWSVAGKTGNAGRKEFTLQDKVTADPADETVQKALTMDDFDITVKSGKEDAKHYTKDTLPDDAKFTAGNDSFKLTFANLPKGTEVTVTYSVRIDRDAYLAAGGEEGKVLSVKNAFQVTAADGAVDSDSKNGTIEVKKLLTKSGKVITKKADNGNPIVTWDFDVNLYSMYTEKELKSLKSATISDVLNPVLITDLSSIRLTDPDGKEIPVDAYKVSQKRSTLAIQITDPAEYPIFHLSFETECGASVEGLVNSADLRIDGTKVISSKTDDIGEISAVTQHGHIKSMRVPEYTPVAWKYLDNELCTKAGLFEFSITQVDENGKKIEGGYTDIAKNDENGKITFKKISYRSKPVEGSYYYQIRESSLVKPYTYTLDKRVFTVRVDVQADGNQYLVTSVVTDPKQYDEVRFDNATVTNRDFTVTKKWNDGFDKNGLRPKAIQVYLLKNGERYENMSVTLSEENNWTYTWKDLPIAGGEYSVEEVPVLGYEADVKDGDWKSTIINTVQTGDLLIAKQVKGTEDPKKKYHFTLTLQQNGSAGMENVALNGTFGDVTFENGIAEFDVKAGSYVRVKGLPAGVYYTVQEDDYTKEGFNSPEYINQNGIVAEDDPVMVTVTNTKAGAVRTGDDGNAQLWAILALLALMGCVAPVMDLRRRRKA